MFQLVNASNSPSSPLPDILLTRIVIYRQAYQNYSFEEIRHASGNWSQASGVSPAFITNGRIPAERLLVRSLSDGSYTASWVPRSPGLYVFRCTFDDLPSPQVFMYIFITCIIFVSITIK